MGDVGHLARAIALAERGRSAVRPNPMVGCVVVANGAVVGEGWHERAGGPHAEVVALTAAGTRALGATAFVSLEPCAHHGRTPPCTAALVDAGVARVVYAARDPHPQAGGGATVLADAGIEVRGGLLAGWARAQNEVFLHVATHARPFVTLKIAQTTTGHLAVPGQRWVTGEVARRRVHRLRTGVDGVLVGSGTVLADDPRLDVRHVPATSQPAPVVLDARGRTPPGARVVRPGTHIVTTGSSDPAWRAALSRAGVRVHVVDDAADGTGVALDATLSRLLDAGVQSLLAEPGATLARALVTAGVVDRLVVHVADAAASPSPRLAGCVGGDWRPESRLRLGDDVELTMVPTARADSRAA